MTIDTMLDIIKSSDREGTLMHWRWWSSMVFAALFALATPGAALAHPEIVRTEPAATAERTAAPTRYG